ncbi:MAG: lolD 1 [Verrucomicrobiales bacterium]|nr:lolD 1 [Verrucomicrobiales bacterium]
MGESKILLELREVQKSFPAADGGAAYTILAGISLNVSKGESLAILGPSGSGKSTLLNIIGTLEIPTSGKVLLDGEDLALFKPNALAQLRNRKLGFVFQAHHLLPQCSVYENVLVPTLASNHTDNKTCEERAKQLLHRVGLGHRLLHFPSQLSGGEKQRVAVVRALINKPEVLLADEPTGALDRTSAEQLGDLLAEINRQDGVTVITVTHSQELARKMSKQLYLRDGLLHSAPS